MITVLILLVILFIIIGTVVSNWKYIEEKYESHKKNFAIKTHIKKSHQSVRNNITNSFIGGDVVGGNSISTTQSFGKTTVTINGKKYTGMGSSVIKNGNVYIGGELMNDDDDVDLSNHTISVEGDVASLSTDLSVVVKGRVTGGIIAGGSITCGDVEGDVNARGGSVNCDNVRGNVEAHGSVNCDNVGGNIDAMGSVNHG